MRALIWDLGGTLVDTYPDVDRALAEAVRAEPDDELLREVATLTRRSSSWSGSARSASASARSTSG